MGDLGCLLEGVEAKSNWSQEDIERYFALSDKEERRDYGGGFSCKIRAYKFGDDIDDLIGRIGKYGLEELHDEGYEIQIMENSGEICGMIATREDEGTRYIGMIAVDEKVEGNGFMGALIEMVWDGRPLTAKVSEDNLHARKAFEKYGFRNRGSLNGWTNMTRR